MDYRNSGNATGDESPDLADESASDFRPCSPGTCPRPDKHYLMDLARRTVREVVSHGALPKIDSKNLSAFLREKKGCFVTLTKKGKLRGCIGNINARSPLYQAIMDNARAAAQRDTRFPAVTLAELDDIQYEISILTDPQLLDFDSPEELLTKLRPHVDGVVLRRGDRTATFLPQVWEQLPDEVVFLNRLAVKAGGAPSDWRLPDTAVSIYQAISFKESDL